MSARGDQRRAVAAFGGNEQAVATYLRDHVLSGLPEQDQNFLTQASILDRISGPVCDYVLETTASAEKLRRLAAENVLLFPADREHRSFRLHPLLGEALRADSADSERRALQQRYGRASQWLEAHGRGREAIEMAIAAGQTSRAARLIWKEAADLVAAGDVTTLERWLDAFSTRQIAANAHLALTAAWCSLLRGRAADHWVSAAEHGADDGGLDGEVESAAAGVALLRGVLAHEGLEQMVRDAREATRLQEPGAGWRCTSR